MTRPPRPPRPVTPLTRLLERLGDDLRRLPIDPDFGRHVEARIRADTVARSAERRRTIPGWAAIAAGVLLTLGAGLSTRSTPAPCEQGTQIPIAPPPPIDVPPDPPPDEPEEPEEEDHERER